MSEAIPSPNIWRSPEVYETENRGVDRDLVIERAILRLLGREAAISADPALAAADAGAGSSPLPFDAFGGLDLVDLGCGSGFHLPHFACWGARSVVGVEPHPPLVELARRRVEDAGLRHVEVVQASAAATGLPDASVDLAHARWAYFFGPGCEPGLAELGRIMRPGGLAVVVDNDASTSTFGRWFSAALPDYDAAAIERFWRRQGWVSEPLTIAWTFDSRADFEAVLRIELAPEAAEAILAEGPERTGVDYGIMLRHKRF